MADKILPFFILIKQEDILSTGNLELLARKTVEGYITGFHKSPFHGFSVEFAEHRQYNSGESVKYMDWKLYARTDKLFVKRYEEETNLRCRIILDTSSSMQFGPDKGLSKLQFSVWSAAVFLHLLKKQRDASGISLFDTKIKESTKISSSVRHYKELYTVLERLLSYHSSEEATNLAEVLHHIADNTHRRSMIVLFTDLFEQQRNLNSLFDALQHLKHNKHEIILFHTMHYPTELELEYGKRPITFQDMESGEKIRVQANELKSQYRNSVQKYLAEIKLKMNQYKIDFVEADIAQRMEHILIPFLTKRHKMTR